MENEDKNKPLFLVPLGQIDQQFLEKLRPHLEEIFSANVQISNPLPVPKVAYNSHRNQYNSTAILKYLLTQLTDYDRPLAIVDVDLFAYGLNFVFGEADVLHKMAIISLTRLRQEFYGLPLLFLFLGGGKLIRASFSIRSIATRQLISFNFPSGLNHCN